MSAKRKICENEDNTAGSSTGTAKKISKVSSKQKEVPTTLPPDLAKKMSEWQQQKDTVRERDNYILDNEMYTDCVFSIFGDAVDPIQIKCHRVYLAKSSPVFSSMFYGDLKRNTEEVIHLPDVNLEAFKLMITYIYNGEIDLNKHPYPIVCALLYVAKKYLLADALLEQIYEYLWQNIYPDNAWTAMEFAENNNEPELEQAAWEIIQLKTVECLESPNFDKIPLKKLERLTSEKELQVPEVLLFNASVRWAESQIINEGREINPISLRRILNPILPNIRFLAMTGKEFVTSVANTKILSYNEMCPILTDYHIRSSLKLPKIISDIKLKRKTPTFDSFYVFGTPKDEINRNEPDTLSVYLEANTMIFNSNDNESTLAGIEIPTQINKKQDDQLEYNEEITVCIMGTNNKCLIEYYTESTVKYNSIYQVPCASQPHGLDEITSINVVFHKSGRYPYKSNIKVEDLDDYDDEFANNVKLEFKDYSNFVIRLISSEKMVEEESEEDENESSGSEDDEPED